MIDPIQVREGSGEIDPRYPTGSRWFPEGERRGGTSYGLRTVTQEFRHTEEIWEKWHSALNQQNIVIWGSYRNYVENMYYGCEIIEVIKVKRRIRVTWTYDHIVRMAGYTPIFSPT